MRKRAVLGAAGRRRFSAPLAAHAAGSVVGVPTGTSLTSTSGLPAEDSIASFSRTDPITGAAVSLTGVRKWSNRHFTATVTGPVPAGEVWWFDQCLFSPPTDNFFCLDTETPNGANTRLSPTIILTRCSIGPDTARAGKALATHRAWIENCDVNRLISGEGRTEDSWIGGAFCTVIESNFHAGIGTEIIDPHADGVQLTDTGASAFYRCWFDGGQMTGFFQGNSCIRVGTEFGAVDGIDMFYNGFGGRSGNNVQFRAQPNPLSNIRFRGNRWCTDGAIFLYDFQQASGSPAMITEWTDNRIGINCTIGGVSYAAGDLVGNPGA